MLNRIGWGLFASLCFFPIGLQAQEQVPTVVIDGKSDLRSPLKSHSTYKTESVSKEKLKDPSRQNLSELVSDQAGVESQTYCANCGAKRLTINGLKGEHTSILIDGLPLHSAISSFYGVDAIPVNGIDQINVMRGTGASLTNPEAIGGTLDLITIDPLQKKQIYTTSLSVNDSFIPSAQNHSALVSIQNEDKNLGFSFGLQYTLTKPWDEDQNGIAELPKRDNISAIIKSRFLPNDENDLSLRLGVSDLTILGGATQATRPTSVRAVPAQETDFVDGSTEKQFIGDPIKVTDWISLKRYEVAFHWTNYLSQSSTLSWNTGYARQEQSSIYQHGFDYAHNDHLFVTDLSLEWLTSNSHILKAGLLHKFQLLRSTSDILFVRDGLPKDNFNHTSLAGYFQYGYLISDSLEMDFAIRLDRTHINWLALSNEVSEFVIAPRYQIRHDLTDHLSQRFSYGLGYRSPLTFFESQHGNNENGYQVNITKLEKAHSFVYSLSYNTPAYYITAGTHYTRLMNMAYGFETQGQPILYQNTTESFDLWANDLLLGYQLTPEWMLEGSVEFFFYPNSYTRKLPTAAIEKRYQLSSNFHKDKWSHLFKVTLVGGRDLSRYGSYNNHFVDRNQFPSPETQGDELKDQSAPAYFVFDSSVTYEFIKNYKLTFGVNNIFDETQASSGDTPAAWHWHFDHAHYDGLHTWGMNKGREYFLKLAAEF